MHGLDDQAVARVSELLKGSTQPVALTGAGISAESGVPTFRSGDSGFWGRFRPEDLATPEAFAADPLLVWCWYAWRRAQLAEVAPNDGHRAMAAFEQLPGGFTVITQNVDGLHQAGGSHNVIEVHGSIAAVRCSADCGARRYLLHEHNHKHDHNHDRERDRERDRDASAEAVFASDREVARLVAEQGDAAFATISEGSGLSGRLPPQCSGCGAYLRPDVVWFGEQLPLEAVNRAFELSESADLFLVVGTSSVVYPAAALPEVAAERGAVLVEINPEPTPLSDRADVVIRSGSGPALSAVAQRLGLRA